MGEKKGSFNYKKFEEEALEQREATGSLAPLAAPHK